MSTHDFIEDIRRESELLAAAAEKAPWDAPVPSCPGWKMPDLVSHIGVVQLATAITLETRATERVDRTKLPPMPDGAAAAVAWFRQNTARLLKALKETDPATPVWTFTPVRSAAFWHRRGAHEVAIHRWDAQHAVGKADPVPAAMAVDNVDELLEMNRVMRMDKFKGAASTIHLHATDGTGEWMIHLGPDGITFDHEHAKGDAAARGTASDLALFLWGRITDETLTVFGDRALLTRLQGLTAL